MSYVGHKLRRLFSSGWFLLTLSVMALLLALSTGRVFVRRAAFYREIGRLQTERDTLISRTRSYQDQIAFLSTEAFLEQEAREKFGQARPGETLVYVEEQPVETGDATEARQRSRPQQWFEYFFRSSP